MRTSDEKVAFYSKKIEITDCDIVFVHVYARAFDGHQLRRVGFTYFDGFHFTLEKRSKQAHIWADKHIALCIKYEV